MAQQKKLTKEQMEACRVLTSEFRVSHPHMFVAQAPKPTDKKKFSVTMLVRKDTDDIKIYRQAIREAKLAFYGPKENWPEGLVSPIRDGDGPDFQDEDGNQKEGYAGHWVIKASSDEDQKPGLVDETVKPILDQGKFYPGCYARAFVFAYRYEYMKKEGISFILDHVQKTRDGKPLSARKTADQVFSPVAAASGKFDADEDEDSETFR